MHVRTQLYMPGDKRRNTKCLLWYFIAIKSVSIRRWHFIPLGDPSTIQLLPGYLTHGKCALPLPTWYLSQQSFRSWHPNPHLAVYNAEVHGECQETLLLVMSLFPKLCWGLTQPRKRTGKSWVYRVTWKKCHLAHPDFTSQLGLSVTPRQELRLLYWREYWN